MTQITSQLIAVRSEQLQTIKSRIAELELQRLVDLGLFGGKPVFHTTTLNIHPSYIPLDEQVEDNSEAGARLRNSSLLG